MFQIQSQCQVEVNSGAFCRIQQHSYGKGGLVLLVGRREKQGTLLSPLIPTSPMNLMRFYMRLENVEYVIPVNDKTSYHRHLGWGMRTLLLIRIENWASATDRSRSLNCTSGDSIKSTAVSQGRNAVAVDPSSAQGLRFSFHSSPSSLVINWPELESYDCQFALFLCTISSLLLQMCRPMTGD